MKFIAICWAAMVGYLAYRALSNVRIAWRSNLFQLPGLRVFHKLLTFRRGAKNLENKAIFADFLEMLQCCIRCGSTPYLGFSTLLDLSPLSTRLQLALNVANSGGSLPDGVRAAFENGNTERAHELADALELGEHTGTKLSESIVALAADLRNDIRREAETNARKVPVRMLFPLVFLILPAFGLLTVVPALITGLQEL